MADDVLITPASRKIEFFDSSNNIDAKIELDSSGNLVITNPGGDISLGDTTADIFVGDGVNNIDIVFEQNGEIRGVTGVTLTLGQSDSSVQMATDLDLNTNDITNVNNLTVSGYLAGPSTFTIDPAGVGDNTGTVVIAGNLQVDGTTTTINSTTVTVDDLNLTLASGAANAAAANGAGLTVDGANATITYDSSNDEWDFNKNINITGNLILSGTVDGRDLATDGTKLDGIEANATADQTASEILTAIKTVDGSGSGLDADLLDGQQGSYYLNTSTSFGGDVSGTYNNIVVSNDSHSHSNYLINNGNASTTGYLQAEGFVGSGGTGTHILAPHGAHYATNTSSITGAIKVTLPQSWTNTMLRFTVKVFEYTSGESFDIVCAGYNYAPSSAWINTSAYILGDPHVSRNFNVRFGHDGSKCCVYIGETSSTWSYPQVMVSEFYAGYGNYSIDSWNDDWSIGFATSFGTITSTRTNNEIGRYVDNNIVWHAGNDGTGSGLDADTVDGVQGASFLRSDAADTATGNLTFDGTVTIDQQIIHKGDTNTYIEYHAADSFRVVTGGTERLEVTNSGVRFSDAFTLPTSDGSANQVLTTDGSGTVTWADGGGGSARTEAFPTVTNGSANVTMAASYTLAQIDVYLNGARMKGGTDYSVSGTTLTFSENLTTGDVVALYAYDTAENLITGNWSDLNDVSVTGAATNTMVRFDGGNYVAASTTEDSSGNLSVSGNATLSGNLSVGGNATLTGDLTVSGGQVGVSTVSTRHKYSVYGSSGQYAIGMQSGITFGGLADWGMTFQFNSDDDRGFWWGDESHSTAQGAMALTTNGKLTVAHSARIGYGESDTTTPGATHRVDVNGSVNATTYHGDGSNLTGISAGATGGSTDQVFYENDQTITTNYTITTNKNAMTAGPITINTGVTVTIPTGSEWSIV